ncbi:GNAT family N-acetyltransferase [Rhizobium tumorigenes]|uniref:GNAT family N-acetyltransferase n=1 Tax=Rhizobium tumorigenes TaxID=2041385 RepID=A0AAF1K3K6_9HYPH|nr:GNAT family N-acetyltransferase [Rhizobium tumorigenes]WFR94831.1 GNAT family N-acetyltransferase [Rhizobium tumorigenes]
MQILRLRDNPAFADAVADRSWNAWWTETGVTLAQYRAHLDPMIENDGIPFCLIAEEGGVYIGSVLVIENDLDARPDYTPWIAALWVEPQARKRGAATRLIAAARAKAAKWGKDSCYLCATPEMDGFYLGLGFEPIETDISGLNIFRI